MFLLERAALPPDTRVMPPWMISLRNAAALGLAASATSFAAIAPYSEDFESVAVGNNAVSNFTESNTSMYTIVQDSILGDQNYRASLSANSGALNGSSAISIPSLAGSEFTISTQFRINSFTTTSGSTINLGLGILGDNPNFSTGNQYRILFTVTSSTVAEHGAINIQENGTTFASQARGAGIGVELDVEYLLSVTGTYSGSTISLLARATRLDTMASTTTTVTDATPPSGEYFGYRTALNAVSGTASESIDYDNFAAVPEPGSAMLLCGALGLLAAGRRRSAR